MGELKVTEKQALVRKEAVNTCIPADAVQVGTSTYILPVEYGHAKIVISAIKETPEFDLDKLGTEYQHAVALKIAAAEAKAAEKA